MTTILQLPEEVLLTIFEDFDFEDSRECQEVCRAWYRPAHLKNLQTVELWDPVEMEKFIASIDSNPNPEYLRAVRQIKITNTEYDSPPPVQYRLSKQNIVKLFHRFPNLQEIEVHGDLTILDNIDEKLSKALLEACPKLETFQVEREDIFEDTSDDTAYYNILFKIRHLLTKLEVRNSSEARRFGTVQDFITSFPRLRDVRDITGRLDSFRKFLPVFKNAPLLEHLKLCPDGDDDDVNYTDTYIAKHPSIVKTLSNITELDLFCCRGISAESFDFIKKYLTGIDVFHNNSSDSDHWTDLEEEQFCDNTLDLIPFVKKVARFSHRINHDALIRCLSTIMRKLFRQVPPPNTNTATRVLYIELDDSHNDPQNIGTAKLGLGSWKSEKLVEIAFNNTPSLDEIDSNIFDGGAPVHDIDRFILDIQKRGDLSYYDHETTMEMYDSILGKMPCLKLVVLGVPLSFVETTPTPDQYNVLPKVEEVTIKATADARFQTLLDGCFYSFPNLKRLYFYYFSGIWNKDMGEFKLDLPKYELDTLVLDVTTVWKKMENVIEKECFVLEVDLLSKGRREIYIVSSKDLSFSKMTDAFGLNGCVRGKDYYRLYITINRLRTLKIWTHRGGYSAETESYGFWNTAKHDGTPVTIFNEDEDEISYC